MTDLAFNRWVLDDPSTVAPIFTGCRRGVYVLEFKNAERYVGQTVNVVTRYSTHRHGSRHHRPWLDVVAIEFMEVPDGDLDRLEQETIRAQKVHYKLRNRTFNFGHGEPSVLDPVVSLEVQRHWATGQPSYSVEHFRLAAARSAGLKPLLLKKRRGQECLPDR